MEEQKMPSFKHASIETIKRLPDQCSFDDIMYEINFVAQVYEGLKDADNGKVISTEELLKRVEQWQK
jgi:predicted transcriptional regulator